jgi:hypothetical protein
MRVIDALTTEGPYPLVIFHHILSHSCSKPLNNYMVFNDSDGLYTYTFEAEKKVIVIIT